MIVEKFDLAMINALADKVAWICELECACSEVFRRENYTPLELADMAFDWSWTVVDGKATCPDCQE